MPIIVDQFLPVTTLHAVVGLREIPTGDLLWLMGVIPLLFFLLT